MTDQWQVSSGRGMKLLYQKSRSVLWGNLLLMKNKAGAKCPCLVKPTGYAVVNSFSFKPSS